MAPCAVYRAYDKEGQLLYVGKTPNVLGRTRNHLRSQSWSQEIADIKVTWYADHEAAVKAEQAAIRKEHPKYNINLRPKIVIARVESLPSEKPEDWAQRALATLPQKRQRVFEDESPIPRAPKATIDTERLAALRQAYVPFPPYVVKHPRKRLI